MSSSSTYDDSSPSGKFRILEIKLQSADLNIKKNGRVYVKLWIHPDRALQTSVMYLSSGGSTPAVWEEKFIFSVSENFLHAKNNHKYSNIFFEIYRARKFLKDQLIGAACCDLKSLFQQHDHSIQDHSSEEEEYCSFDSEINEYSDEEEDPRFDNMFEPAENDDGITGEIDAKNNPSALRATTSLTAAKGLKPKGTLKIEAAVWKGFIGCVGDHKWRKAAMPYDELMGLTNPMKKKKKKDNRKVHHYKMCFTSNLVCQGRNTC